MIAKGKAGKLSSFNGPEGRNEVYAGARLLGTGSLSGKVTNSSGAGIQIVRVKVFDSSPSQIDSVDTDASGNYSITGLQSGIYKVYFDSAYYGGLNYIPQWYNNKTSLAAADNVSVTEGNATSGIDAQLAPGGIISGTVTAASGLQAAGTGIQNVLVKVYDSSQTQITTADTDASGNYSITGLQSGLYKVYFDSVYHGGLNYIPQWYNNKTSLAAADNVTVTAGSTTAGINAQLAAGGIISGTVTNASGAGIGDVSIGVFTEDHSPLSEMPVTTNSSGFYRVTGLPAGYYKVYFDPPSSLSDMYAAFWYNGKLSFDASDSVAVKTGAITPDINCVLPFASTAVIALSRRNLYYTATTAGACSGNQQVAISNTGASVLTWSAAGSAGWLSCAPSSGAGTRAITVSVNPAGLGAGTYSGRISVTGNATNSPQVVNVLLTVKDAGTTLPPFGEFSTPVDGTTSVTGAIPVTGWVVDDVEVTRVEVKRDSHASDPPGAIGPDGLVFVGYGIFVEGARPDIESGYPGYPMNYKAGWGYMLLTNFLPNGGNGTSKLHAFAFDKEGNVTLLGSKTIVCSNATASKPFGTIDTPIQGGDASGNLFLNFGWVLTPMPKTVPKDGSTIGVFVDSVKIGNLATAPNVYNQYRVDVATAFPGLKNSGGPVGAFYLDTTKYANGVHTIFWIATDDAGAADGIGSRYFNIINTGTAPIQNGEIDSLRFSGVSTSSHREERSDAAIRPEGSSRALRGISSTLATFEDILNLPLSFDPLSFKTGFNLKAEPVSLAPDNYGAFHVRMREVELLEIGVASTIGRKKVKNVDATPILSGYMIVGEELRPLPIGSTLDARTGTFSWMPGPGFVGEYDLVFIVKDGFGIARRISLNVRIVPKTGEIATPQYREKLGSRLHFSIFCGRL